MNKTLIFILSIIVIFISGCTAPKPIKHKKPLCIIHPTSKDKNITKDDNISISNEDKELQVIDDGAGGSNRVEEEYGIDDVFTDSMFLNGDRIKLIKNLDALPLEKKSLLKAYKNHTKLWKRKQREEFAKILEDDKYLSLCGDRRYYDNLLFTTEEPQVDILYSILLIKYINNLSHGCKKWVYSKLTNNLETKDNIPRDYLLDMVEKGAIVERLFVPFIPKPKKLFRVAIREYKSMHDIDEKSKKLRDKHLEIESMKESDKHPSYQK